MSGRRNDAFGDAPTEGEGGGRRSLCDVSRTFLGRRISGAYNGLDV